VGGKDAGRNSDQIPNNEMQTNRRRKNLKKTKGGATKKGESTSAPLKSLKKTFTFIGPTLLK